MIANLLFEFKLIVFFIFKSIIFLTLFISLANAEQLSLNDLTEYQIIKTYGKPDNIVKSSKEDSRWLYGKSLIFFTKGKVSAWSDQGDLLSKESGAIKLDHYMQGWKNAWTYKSLESKDKVLLDFIKDNVEIDSKN